MALPREMEERLIVLCKKYSINSDDVLKFIRQVIKAMDGYYLFDSGNKIDLIYFSRVFIYYFEFKKDKMICYTRHLSDISKIMIRLNQEGIDIGIFFDEKEGIEFVLPYKQYSTWMGFYRTLKVFWANTRN